LDDAPGVLVKASYLGAVHTIIEKNLPNILSHFQIDSMEFESSEVSPIIPPQAPPSIDEDVPSKEIIIQAAKRALAIADRVSTHLEE
jgi:hypothetical protein